MAAGLLVTGTDTGVGKTLISCALLRALSRRGLRMGVYKPVETGVPRDTHGTLRGEDCGRLIAAAAQNQPLASVSTALFPIPAAPLVSAEAEGSAIDPGALARDFQALTSSYDGVLVEGAGGLLVPIAPDFTFADLALLLDVPVLLVVGSKLGCINHALLTLSELDRRGIPVVGYVINELEGESQAAHALASNRDTLARFAKHRDLGRLPCVPPEQRDDYDAIAALAEDWLDLAEIEGRLGISARP